MQKFDVLKTNVGSSLWHTLPHSLLTLVPLLYWANGVCIFRPLVPVLSALSTSIYAIVTQSVAVLVWLTYFTCFGTFLAF